MNQPATNAYIELQLKAARRIEMLKQYFKDHQERQHPNKINWGHVGDLQRAISQIDEVLGIDEIKY